MYPVDEAIAAVASPPGGGPRGILRLSGPDAIERLVPLFRTEDGERLLSPRMPTVVAGTFLVSPKTGLPCRVYLWPSGRSYTGQPAGEIHSIGSPPLLAAALRTLCGNGFRLAGPGEFTLRAFLAGRIDLTQAEAVLGVIDAADTRQFDVALTQLAGGVAGPLQRLRDQLLDLLAHLEAGFDFADEDLSFITEDELERQLSGAAESVKRLADQMASRAETADRVRVALVGWPNTGKSSLFNALAGTLGAMISDQPGTTRDYLTAELDLGGLRCLLTDTAGIETEPDPLAPELWTAAQAASGEQARQAGVRLLCLDSTRPLYPGERSLLADRSAECLTVLTKCDLRRLTEDVGPALHTSAVTGKGMNLLKQELRAAALGASSPGREVVAGTAARCHESLRMARESLGRALDIVRTACAEELIAIEVRTALEELGKVVGAVYTDDVLDRIFHRFCIGK